MVSLPSWALLLLSLVHCPTALKIVACQTAIVCEAVPQHGGEAEPSHCDNLGAVMSLDCGPDRVILLTGAFYGRLDTDTCPDPDTARVNSTEYDQCYFDAMDLAESRCGSKRSCELKSCDYFYNTDPCDGIYKYSRVDFQCIPEGKMPTNNCQAPKPAYIPLQR